MTAAETPAIPSAPVMANNPLQAANDQAAVPEAIAPANVERAVELSRQSDQKRPSDQLQVPVLGRPLNIGGEVSTKTKYRKDFTLDNRREDDLLRLDSVFQLEFFYGWNDSTFLFVEGAYRRKDELYVEGGDEQSQSDWQRGQTWIYLTNLYDSPFSLQVGRQTMRDKREWWWDKNLDAVRVEYDKSRLHMEVAAAKEVARVTTDEDDINPADKDVFRLLAKSTWKWAEKQRLEFFFLHQDDSSDTLKPGDLVNEEDEDKSDGRLTWIGARTMGRWKYKPLGRFYYWGDVAAVRGDEDLADFDDAGSGISIVDTVEKFDINGWGLDVGATLQTKWKARPRLTASYAFGSGDNNPKNSTDHNFRQTGLQRNNGKWRGVDRFRYYGELLRPELSNLHIATLGLGFPLLSNSSVEFVYHQYRQDEAATKLRNARIRARPTGENKDIGREFDVVLGIEEWKHWEIELIGAVFESGDAYGSLSGNQAYNAVLHVDYNF